MPAARKLGSSHGQARRLSLSTPHRAEEEAGLRLLGRFIGLLLLAAAFVAFVVDGTRSIAGRRLLPTSLGETIAIVTPALAAALQPAPAGRFAGVSEAVAAVLDLPSWLVLGSLGAVLLAVARKRKPTIGILLR